MEKVLKIFLLLAVTIAECLLTKESLRLYHIIFVVFWLFFSVFCLLGTIFVPD